MAKVKEETKAQGSDGVEEPKAKAPKKVSEADLSTLVDLAKANRARAAAAGKAKPDTSELKLANQFRAEYEGDALVMKIYEGLGGLVNKAKAAKNREAEAKEAKIKRSR